MTWKSNVDVAERTIYYALSGDDDQDGTTIEIPKRTIQAAIDAANALIPTVTDPVSVISSQGGIFTETFAMEDFISLDTTPTTIAVDAPIAIECSSLAGIRAAIVLNEQDNASVFLIDTKDSFTIDLFYTCVMGDGAIIFDMQGACESIFIESINNQILGLGSICYQFTGTASSVMFLSCRQIDLLDTDVIGIVWDSVSTGVGAIEAIRSNGINAQDGNFLTGTDTIGLLIKKGFYDANIATCVATTILKVESGAFLRLELTSGLGDIIVDAGGRLDCDIITHVGVITNNGTINGNINGVPFGTYRQKHEEQVVLNAFSLNTQAPAATDTLLQVEFGAAQFGPTDPVQLSVLGAVTINESDQYNVSIVLQYGRSGAAGSSAIVFFRILLDGVQFGPTRYAQLDNPNQAFPIQFSIPMDLIAAQVLTVEFWRDSSGFNAGELMPRTPVLIGPNTSPSAAIILTRNRLVQPV